jgi:hypothetical protein
MTFVSIDPDEVQVGDVATEITHYGFHTCVQIWLKIKKGARGWGSTLELQKQYHYTSYLAESFTFNS